jgi:hypothetical protein
MKKIILAAALAISVSCITSCNSKVEPKVYTDQELFAISVSDLMRNGVFEIFAYEEIVSTKIAKGEELSSAITVITNEFGDTIGWKSSFKDETVYFQDSLTVMFDGAPLDDNSTKTIDCSKLTLKDSYGNPIKFFGTINVTNVSTSETSSKIETAREVNTNQFGWGKTNDDFYINAFNSFYTLSSEHSKTNYAMTKCTISGGANGNHTTYGIFSQNIDKELICGQNVYFTDGSMILTSVYFDGSLSLVTVSFTSNSMVVAYNGNTYVVY